MFILGKAKIQNHWTEEIGLKGDRALPGLEGDIKRRKRKQRSLDEATNGRSACLPGPPARRGWRGEITKW